MWMWLLYIHLLLYANVVFPGAAPWCRTYDTGHHAPGTCGTLTMTMAQITYGLGFFCVEKLILAS